MFSCVVDSKKYKSERVVNMIIEEMLKKHYNIENISNVQKTVYGSGNTYIVSTPEKKYMLKSKCKVEDAEIYRMIEKENICANIPKPYWNSKDDILTESSFILYEFYEGETLSMFDDAMVTQAIVEIKNLNNQLKLIRDTMCFKVTNDWDRIRDNDYILNELYGRITKLEMLYEWKTTIIRSIEYLKENKELLNSENYQLIHLDLGPDNFLVNGNIITKVLDFTPGYNLELLSLAQFVYWNYFWNKEVFEEQKVNDYLRHYCDKKDVEKLQHEFNLSIILACLYRVVGLLLDMERSQKIECSRLEKRMKILNWNLNRLAMHSF